METLIASVIATAINPVAVPADVVTPVPVVTDLRRVAPAPVSGSWEAEAARIQAKNVANGFLPIRPSRPPLSFERSEFADAPYPEQPVGSLEERLAAFPPERCNIKQAIKEFSENEGRKPASPDEVMRIAREAGIREVSFPGLYRDFEFDGYLTVIKHGKPVLAD